MLTWIVRVMRSLINMELGSRATSVTRRPNIPTEVLSNILVRLPAATLQRLKYVSKEWLEVISDPDFAELHLANQPLEFELIYSLLNPENPDLVSPFFLESPELYCFKKRKMPSNIEIYGTCKGLVLFTKVNDMCVVNPITGYTLCLPPVPQYDQSIVEASIGPLVSANIGYDPSSKRCKVFVLHTMKCYVLTLHEQGCSAWREVKFPVQSVVGFYNPIVARGCLHWIYRSGIISVDLGQEKFLEITELPFSSLSEANRDNGPLFLEWDGGLAVIPKYRWQPSYCIFILRDSMWTELQLDITFFEHLCPSEKFGQTPPYPVASLRNGEVIIFKKLADSKSLSRVTPLHLVDHNRFFAYHLQDRVMTPFAAVAPNGESIYEIDGYYWNGSIMPHVNSIISC